MIRTATLIAAGAVFVMLLPQSALAKPDECTSAGPWVLAEVHAPLPVKLDAAGVLDRLGVELAMRGWSLCIDSPSEAEVPRVATASFRGPGAAAAGGSSRRTVTIDVEVVGRFDTKRATRAVDLSSVPRDSSSTVVALAADELIRAAWDELALAPAPVAEVESAEPIEAERAPDPPIVAARHVDAAEPPPAKGPPWALGLRGGAELWSGGLAFFGGDGAVAVGLSPRTRLELHGGARASLPSRGPDGTVEAQAACLRLGASIALLRPGPTTEIGVASRLGAYAVRMAGQPISGAAGSADTSGAFTLETGPTFSVALGKGGTALVLDAMVAGAMRGVAARDGDAVVTGMSGVAFTTSAGVLVGVP